MQVTTYPSTDSELSKAFDYLAYRLVRQAGYQVCSELTGYMKLPHQLNQMNAEIIASGQLDVNDQLAGEQYLWRQARLFDSISYVGYALIDGNRETGAGRWIDGVSLAVYENCDRQAFDYATDDQGNRIQLIQTYNFDPVSPTRIQRVLDAGRSLWTEIYISDDIHNVKVADTALNPLSQSLSSNIGYQNYVAINAERPLYSKSGELIGVLIVDVLLNEISKFLDRLQASFGGQIFIIERDGRLVGCSNHPSILTANRSDRLNLLTIPDRTMRSIARELQKLGDFQTICAHQLSFILNGQRQFVDITPWHDEYGLNWLVITSVSESELTAGI
jgi:hypothetical protein